MFCYWWLRGTVRAVGEELNVEQLEFEQIHDTLIKSTTSS